MRRLISFSFGDKLKFKWEETAEVGVDTYQLIGKEAPAPELKIAYDRLILLFQSVFVFADTMESIAAATTIKKVELAYSDNATGGYNRAVKIWADYYISGVSDTAVMVTPFVDDGKSSMYLPKGDLKKLLDILEDECWRYVEGWRAQTQLQFEAMEDKRKDEQEHGTDEM